MSRLTAHWMDKQRRQAKQRLSRDVYDFVMGGADDESALKGNLNAFRHFTLLPRVLTNTESVTTQLTVCHTSLSSPVIIAPTAPHKLLHSEGELATVKAAASTNTLMVVSCMASYSLETIAQAAKGAPLWFQIHIFKNRHVTENLIKRAEESGYQAVVVTVDAPKLGNRQRDLKNQFKIPDSCLAANLLEEQLIMPSSKNFQIGRSHTNHLFDLTVTWDDIKKLRAITSLPILLKGILHPEDAKEALDVGIDGIIVSNHGGRQLGAAIAPLDALPHIVQTVNHRLPVLMDGGIRSGTDVVKALALGARAVLIGRPVLWALAVGGSYGVSGAINQLNRELIHVMQLCGYVSMDCFKTRGLTAIRDIRLPVI